MFIHLFIYKFIYLCVYFGLRWVFAAVCRLSLVVASGVYSWLRCAGLLIAVASLAVEHGL